MRQISAEMKAALRRRDLAFALLLEIDHPNGMDWVWSGVGPVSWNERKFKGLGALGSLEGLEVSSELATQNVRLVLNRVPHDIADTVSLSLRGRTASAWWAALTDHRTVVPHPLALSSFDLDVQKFDIADTGECSLIITGKAGLWALEKPTAIALTDEEQQRRYPGDTGFSLRATLQNKQHEWGLE